MSRPGPRAVMQLFRYIPIEEPQVQLQRIGSFGSIGSSPPYVLAQSLDHDHLHGVSTSVTRRFPDTDRY